MAEFDSSRSSDAGERPAVLHLDSAIDTLFDPGDEEGVVAALVGVLQQALNARVVCVFLQRDGGAECALVHHIGLSQVLREAWQRIRPGDGTQLSDVMRTRVASFTDAGSEAAVSEAGFHTQAILPFGVDGSGGLVFLGFDAPFQFEPAHREYLQRVMAVLPHALHAEDLKQRHHSAALSLAYVERAADILASATDRRAALQELARMSLPRLGDFTLIEVLGDDGELTLGGLAHVRPAEELALRAYHDRYQPGVRNPTSLIFEAIRTRKPVVRNTLPEFEMLAQDADQLMMLRVIHPRACLILPLLRFGEVLGTMAFGVTTAAREYEAQDMAIATAVADRVSSVLYSDRLIARAEAARDGALTSNEALQDQALELEQQVEEAQVLSEELEQTVEELRTSETRFRALIEASTRAIWRAESNGDVRVPSPSWERLTGFPMEVPRTESQPHLIHPDDVDATMDAWRHAIATGTPYESEHRMRLASGEYRWFHARAVPILDEGGASILEWVGMHTDIHDRLIASNEQQLLLRIGNTLQQEPDADRMVQSVLRELVQFLDVTQARLSEIDPDEGVAMLRSTHVVFAGAHEMPAAAPEVVRLQLTDISTDLDQQRQGQPLLVEDTSTDPRTAGQYAAMFAPRNTRALLSVPLLRAGRWIASFSVSSATPRAWQPREVEVVRLVGDKVWPAFLATRAFREARNARREAEQRAAYSEMLSHQLETINAQLATKEARLAGIIGAAMDAIISVDDKGRIVVFNTAAERAFGIAASQALGELVDRFIPDRFRTSHVELVAQFEATGATSRSASHPAEVVARRLDGTEFPAEATISGIATDNGPLSTVVLRDVTERRALEAQLIHSQKMEAVGQLAGGVAHDFNNILMVIRSCADFLRDAAPAGHDSIPDLDEIIAASERAASLTRQLLAFSRKQVLMPRVVNVAEVVSGIQGMLRRIIGEDIEIAVLFGPEGASVRADVGQLEQVILNLSVNARDAMQRGGILTIETDVVSLSQDDINAHALTTPAPGEPELPGEYAVLRVSDTGAGIPPAVQARIFEPFFTTKREGKGTGLGLATVHGIAGQSGGFMRVHSEQDVGTTFELFLPRVREGSSGEYAAATMAKQRRGTATVLLVEDEATVRRSVSRMLTRAGYRVLEARHGADALLILGSHGDDIHLLITDLRMPELGGHELIGAMRKDRPTLPVIAMSGYPPNLGEMETFPWQELGPLRFLGKPFSSETLLEAVQESLQLP